MTLIIEVFIKAFLLCILIYVVAREEADYEFRKVTMVTAGIILGAVIIDATLTRFVGLFALIPIVAFVVFMVMQFCWLRFWQALLVAIPFLILNIMISGAATSFQTKANLAVARGLQGPISEEDMKIALSFYQDGGRTNEFLAAAMARRNEAPPPNKEMLEGILLPFLQSFFSSGKLAFKPALAAKPPARPAEQPVARPEQEITAPRTEIRSEVKESSDPEWQEAGKKISVRGIMVSPEGVRVALVNNRLAKEGEIIQVEHRKMIYRWRLKAIRDNKISWEPAEVLKK